jgi:hypothetical protein
VVGVGVDEGRVSVPDRVAVRTDGIMVLLGEWTGCGDVDFVDVYTVLLEEFDGEMEGERLTPRFRKIGRGLVEGRTRFILGPLGVEARMEEPVGDRSYQYKTPGNQMSKDHRFHSRSNRSSTRHVWFDQATDDTVSTQGINVGIDRQHEREGCVATQKRR